MGEGVYYEVLFLGDIINQLNVALPLYDYAKLPLIKPSHLTALWHYLEFLPGVNVRTNALAVGTYSYSNMHQCKQIGNLALFCSVRHPQSN